MRRRPLGLPGDILESSVMMSLLGGAFRGILRGLGRVVKDWSREAC